MKTGKLEMSIWITLLSILLWSSFALGYDDRVTHPELTKKAISVSSLDAHLKQTFFLEFVSGITTTINGIAVRELLTRGSTDEDYPLCRASTHFHNPLKSWATAGASETSQTLFCPSYASPNPGTQYSALVWATGQESADGPVKSRNNQTMGWDSARSYFYTALTANNSADRNLNFAKTFQAVGQVMHLLEDMAVPAHVRDDFWISHVWRGLPNPYEGYVKDSDNKTHWVSNLGQWQIDAVRPDFSSPNVTDYWDTVEGTTAYPLQVVAEIVSSDTSMQSRAGLAEYTNANFVSEGTLFSNSNAFTYPTEDKTRIVVYTLPNSFLKRPYYYKEGYWDGGYILAGVDAASFAKYGLNAAAYSKKTKIPPLDDNVHKDYADRLVPRAVAYSAELLDYFFRGTLDIAWPRAGVYSIADGSKTPYADLNGNRHQQFTKIRAMVMNTTPNESIGTGNLTAVARYKIIPNFAPDLSNYPPDGMAMKAVEYSYSVSKSVPVSEGTITSSEYREFAFNFENSPIPAGITDLTLQVVFKGTIGNETDNAIAVGMRDISEPTHMTFWNLTDMHSIDYPGPEFSLYTFDNLKLAALQDPNYPRLLNLLDDTPVGNPNGSLDDEEFLKGQINTFEVSFWNAREYQPAVSVQVPPEGHIRMIVLADSSSGNFVRFRWYELGVWREGVDSFTPVVNQLQDGQYLAPTPFEYYRKVGTANAPSVQHYYDGAYKCTMLHGNGCSYPVEQADPVTPTPVPFVSVFD